MKNSENSFINYYVLEFLIKVDEEGNQITSSMCVLGYRKPTIEEAKIFWKKDCDLCPDEELVNIYKISKKEAYADYDMERENDFPVFGKGE